MLDIEHYRAQRDKPSGKPLMKQHWDHLAFVHAAVEPSLVQKLLPQDLTVDTFAGPDGAEMAWIGLVTFLMRDIRFNRLPYIPSARTFPEFNLRTYVHHHGRNPGVWFFSLDAASWIASIGGRKFYGLPYFWSSMNLAQKEMTLTYGSQGNWRPSSDLKLEITPGPEIASETDEGSLEHFLVERYRLYTNFRGQLQTALVHHKPYKVQPLTSFQLDEGLSLASLGVSPSYFHGLYSPGVEVDVFAPYKCERLVAK